MRDPAPLLDIRQLEVRYRNGPAEIRALNGVDFRIAAGERVGVVGESGSGKTQLLLAALGLLPRSAGVSGSVRYRGQELLGAGESALNALRGRRIAMVFQDPMSALNPWLSIERQMTEGMMLHLGLSRRGARQRAQDLLERAQVSEPERRLRQYPHELSGGMRQRVMIAMAMSCEPELLLADEPTTALDVTIQAEVLQLLRELCADSGTAIVLVTHDLGVLAGFAERVSVMYGGRVAEQAPVRRLFEDCHHPYSEGLQACVPGLGGPIPVRMPTIGGQPPDPAALPPGCAFEPRCLYRRDICRESVPLLRPVGADHIAACHHDGELGRLAKDRT